METVLTHEKETTTHELGKYTRSFGLSFAITSLISSLLVVLKETNEATVLAWMKAATGHHWVTHGIVNLILFVFFGWLLARLNEGQGINIQWRALVTSIVVSAIASGLIIVVFFAR